MPKVKLYVVSTGTAEQIAEKEQQLLAQGFKRVGDPHGYPPPLACRQYHRRQTVTVYGSWQPSIMLSWSEEAHSEGPS